MFRRQAIKLMAGILLITATPAFAQMAQNWNVEDYAASQNNHSLAISHLNEGKPEKALALLNRAVNRDPHNPLAVLTLGNVLCMLGHYDEALDCLRKSYHLHPSDEALLGAGFVYYRERDYDAALKCWNKILEASPKRADIYANIGMAYLRKGQLNDATDAFNRVVKYNPNSSLGYYGLALTNYFAGSLSMSKEKAERAESLDASSPGVLLLARIEFLQGNRAMATKHARQFTAMLRRKTQSRTMTELGFSKQIDFHFDPFLIDNYDNGYLAMAREESNPGRRQALDDKGQLPAVLAEAERIFALSTTVECDQSGGVHRKGPIWSTGVSHDLTHDVYVSHEIGLLQLSGGDFTSAALTFDAVLAQHDSYNVDLLYLAQALAMDGRSAEASEKVAEFRKRQPHEQIAANFQALSSAWQ